MTFFAAILAFTNACGVVTVDTRGARVVSYVPEGGEEVFFASAAGAGGVSLGWLRAGIDNWDFKVADFKRSSNSVGNNMELTLRMASDASTRGQFPHDFALTVLIRLNDRLTISMTGENTGSEPFEVDEAIEPHFAAPDPSKCRVYGIDAQECRFDNPVGGWTLSLTGTECARTQKSGEGFKAVGLRPGARVLKPGESRTISCTIRLISTYNDAKPIDLQPQIESIAAAGGGRVTVPPGKWLSRKAVHLRSNVELHLDDGATLVFPDDPDAYLPAVRSSYSAIEFYGLSPLIYAYGATNVSVTGGGTLTTRMALWRNWFLRDGSAVMYENQRRLYEWGENDVPVEKRRFEDLRTARIRPAFLEFERCANVRLEGFHIRYSPLWCVHLRLCDGVTARGLDIRARGHNNDGIDVNASRNVLIENCTLDQGDDAFVIKSGRDRDGRRVGVPCENVEIRNCTVKGAHTLLGVGSEVSGGIRNIFLHDCNVTEWAHSVIRIKTSDRKGAYIENVAVSNVTVKGFSGDLVSLLTNIDYQWKKYPPREHIVTRIDGFRVENVQAEFVRRVYSLHGDPRLPPQNVFIRNVTAKKYKEKSVAEHLGRHEIPPVMQ